MRKRHKGIFNQLLATFISILTLCFCLMTPILLYAQNETVKIDSALLLKLRNNATYYLNRIEIDSSDFTNYYQLSCNLSLLNENLSAIHYLKIAITKGALGEDVLTDTDFETLRAEIILWAEVEELLKKQYATRNPNITKLNLGYELWQMWIDDQKYRTLKKNYKLEKPYVFNTEKHKTNLQRLKQIVQESGWPKYSEVGKEGGDAAFFVFQHDDAKNMKKILPLFIAAATIGEADLIKAAMMVDRYLCYTENIQIYGTQAFRKIRQGENRKDIPMELYPIADEENLISRRNKLGFSDFLENCKRLNVVYVPIENRTNYKTIQLKKKWIELGYLFNLTE